jgi:hypothetical protein
MQLNSDPSGCFVCCAGEKPVHPAACRKLPCYIRVASHTPVCHAVARPRSRMAGLALARQAGMGRDAVEWLLVARLRAERPGAEENPAGQPGDAHDDQHDESGGRQAEG